MRIFAVVRKHSLSICSVLFFLASSFCQINFGLN